MTNQEEREIFLTEKERFEQYFDLDHDGKLNDTEIFRWLIPDDRATATAEADHILDKSDANKDGKLSLDEIAENYQIFVGSEITDYGNALNVKNGGDEHDELWNDLGVEISFFCSAKKYFRLLSFTKTVCPCALVGLLF